MVVNTICLIATVLAITAIDIACFIVGARIARKLDNDEEIKLPSINPMELVRENRDRREAETEQNKFNVMLENINNYKGDSSGQKDLPK